MVNKTNMNQKKYVMVNMTNMYLVNMTNMNQKKCIW